MKFIGNIEHLLPFFQNKVLQSYCNEIAKRIEERTTSFENYFEFSENVLII